MLVCLQKKFRRQENEIGGPQRLTFFYLVMPTTDVIEIFKKIKNKEDITVSSKVLSYVEVV